MIKRFAITAFAAAALAGCQQVQNYSMGPFPEGEYAALKKSGNAKITGQVFLKTRGGDVKYGAGEEVALVPKTSYTTEYHDAGMAGYNVINVDARYKQSVSRTQADGSGHFAFSHVAPGNYYLQSKVTWIYGNNLKTGGMITKEVIVNDGETLDIMLTE